MAVSGDGASTSSFAEGDPRRVYVRETEAGRELVEAVERDTRALWRQIDLALWVLVGIAALVLGAARGPVAFAQTVGLLGLAVWVSLAVLGSTGPAGLIGTYVLSPDFELRAAGKVDPEAPEVVLAVVEHLAHAPIERGRALAQNLARERRVLQRSLDALARVREGLLSELRGTGDPGSRGPLEGRVREADETEAVLRAADAALSDAEAAVEAALEPLRAELDRFARLEGLVDWLTEVRSSHGLRPPTPMSADERRAHIAALVAASDAAERKLSAVEERSRASFTEAGRAVADAPHGWT